MGEATSEIIEQARSITAKGGVVVAASIAPWDQTSVDLNLFMFSMMNQELRGTVFGSTRRASRFPNSFDSTTKASS